MKRVLQDMLGFQFSIIQAPVGLGAGAPLAAVSNSGGLGTLAVSGRDIDDCRRYIGETRAQTPNPFAANDELVDTSLEEDVAAISLFWG